MTDIDQLLDELQDLVDDKRERVAKLFADIRASVPRPMTLVYRNCLDDVRCADGTGIQYWKSRVFADTWIGCERGAEVCRASSEPEVVEKLQSHFNAAWSAMTAKGAAT